MSPLSYFDVSRLSRLSFTAFAVPLSLYPSDLRSLKIEQQQTYTLRKFALSHRP